MKTINEIKVGNRVAWKSKEDHKTRIGTVISVGLKYVFVGKLGSLPVPLDPQECEVVG